MDPTHQHQNSQRKDHRLLRDAAVTLQGRARLGLSNEEKRSKAHASCSGVRQRYDAARNVERCGGTLPGRGRTVYVKRATVAPSAFELAQPSDGSHSYRTCRSRLELLIHCFTNEDLRYIVRKRGTSHWRRMSGSVFGSRLGLRFEIGLRSRRQLSRRLVRRRRLFATFSVRGPGGAGAA